MDYLNKLVEVHPALKAVYDDILEAFDILKESVINGGKIITCGNVGSSADADHIFGELMKGFRTKSELTDQQIKEIANLYPEEADSIGQNLQQAIPAISLFKNISLFSAFSNDVNSAFVFAQQVYGIGQPGDVLIAISTSGDLVNLIHAAQVAKVKGLKVVALTGASGGKLKKHADVVIQAPSTEVADVQENLLSIYYCLCSMLEQELFSDRDVSCSKKRERNSGIDDIFPPKIELIVFDFDGVFTDNKVYTSQDGTEMVICDRRDSLGISLIKKYGIQMLILSTEANPVVIARARKMGLKVEYRRENKENLLREYFIQNEINPVDVIYMGNDLNDLEAMKMVGFSVAPRDAHPAIREIASLVLKERGGNGAVRELCEYIMQRKEK